METSKKWGISSFILHIIAILFMLCDHLWATIAGNANYLTWIGRMAFPIFAFMIVEGFYKTKDIKKYMKRLLICALITEIPFDLMYSGLLIYPFHQNVLWTFLIGLLCISKIDKIRKEGKLAKKVIFTSLILIIGYIVAFICMADYYGYAILTMFVFYFFRGNGIKNKLGQLIGIIIINCELMGGLRVPINIGNLTFEIQQQAMAVLALIPIWLYNGKQGPYNKYIRYFYYAFYPLHMIILALLAL